MHIYCPECEAMNAEDAELCCLCGQQLQTLPAHIKPVPSQADSSTCRPELPARQPWDAVKVLCVAVSCLGIGFAGGAAVGLGVRSERVRAAEAANASLRVAMGEMQKDAEATNSIVESLRAEQREQDKTITSQRKRLTALKVRPQTAKRETQRSHTESNEDPYRQTALMEARNTCATFHNEKLNYHDDDFSSYSRLSSKNPELFTSPDTEWANMVGFVEGLCEHFDLSLRPERDARTTVTLLCEELGFTGDSAAGCSLCYNALINAVCN